MTTNTRRRAQLAVAAGAAALTVATLTACGSSSSSSSSSAQATPLISQSGVAAAVSQFANCVNQHGVNVGANATIKTLRDVLENTPQAKRRVALSACKQYITSLGIGQLGTLGGS